MCTLFGGILGPDKNWPYINISMNDGIGNTQILTGSVYNTNGFS